MVLDVAPLERHVTIWSFTVVWLGLNFRNAKRRELLRAFSFVNQSSALLYSNAAICVRGERAFCGQEFSRNVGQVWSKIIRIRS